MNCFFSSPPRQAGQTELGWNVPYPWELSFGGRMEVRRTEVSGKLKGVLQGAYAMYPECTDGGVNLGQGHSPAG